MDAKLHKISKVVLRFTKYFIAKSFERTNPRGLDRPGNQEIQLELFYSYRTNPPLYPEWQAYMRKYQPPTLITWGKNDAIFPDSGAYPFERDLKNAELHILDTGHFALEEDGALICTLIDQFFTKNKIG